MSNDYYTKYCKTERDVSHYFQNAIIGLIWLKLNVETAPVSNPIVTDGPTMQDISQCLIEYILPNQWPSIALPWCTLPSWPNIMWCLFSPVIHDFMSALCKCEFKSRAWNSTGRFDDYGYVLNLVMVKCKSNLFDSKWLRSSELFQKKHFVPANFAFNAIVSTIGRINLNTPRARFLSLSQTVLRNCLSQDSSETGLRSLVVSVFYLCLRQKIVLQIQIQVLVNTLSPIKYLIFLKNPVIKRNFIFTKCILILGNYCSIIEPKISVWLFVTQA